MKKIAPFCFTLFLSIIISTTCNAKLFYKKVEIGPGCSFETPFLWKIKKIPLELPDNTRNILVRYESKQCIGKKLIVTSTFAEYNKHASIDGGINETISQISSMKGVTRFKYSLSNYYIRDAKSKICFMTYYSNNTKVYLKSIFIIPNHNSNISYYFSGHYTEKYNEEVVDKIFNSIAIK